MSGPVLETGAVLLCPHGAPASIAPADARVAIAGRAVATKSDVALVSGCPFTDDHGSPRPCLEIRWLTTSDRVCVDGRALLLATGEAVVVAVDGSPVGPPIVAASQSRVTAR